MSFQSFIEMSTVQVLSEMWRQGIPVKRLLLKRHVKRHTKETKSTDASLLNRSHPFLTKQLTSEAWNAPPTTVALWSLYPMSCLINSNCSQKRDRELNTGQHTSDASRHFRTYSVFWAWSSPTTTNDLMYCNINVQLYTTNCYHQLHHHANSRILPIKHQSVTILGSSLIGRVTFCLRIRHC